jgi:hypothetical protein
MIEVIGSAACVALVTALAYVERTKLKADVKATEAKVLTVATKLVAELQRKENAVRAKIAADVAKVVADTRADAAKIIDEINRDAIVDTITKIRNLSANLEADLKKVL